MSLIRFSSFNGLFSILRPVVSDAMMDTVRYASKKAGGTTRNKRKRTKFKLRGPKVEEMEFVRAGQVLVTQIGLKWYPGENVTFNDKKTLIALKDGRVITSWEQLSPYPDSPLFAPTQAGRVLYKQFYHVITEDRPGCTLDCDECTLTFQKIPDKPYNYSDHEGVCANFYLRKNVTALPPEIPFATRAKVVNDAIHAIETAQKRITPSLLLFSLMTILAFGAYCTLGLPRLSVPVITPVARFVVALVFWYLLAHALLTTRFERNGYRNVMGHLLKIKQRLVKSC